MVEEVLTLYIVGDSGKGMESLIIYDKYVSDDPAPLMKLLYRETQKGYVTIRNLVFISDGKIHPFGINEDQLMNEDNVEKDQPIRHMIIYFRSSNFHSWVYCDREHSDIKRVEELASKDQYGRAAPDAVTTCMVSLCGRKKDMPIKEDSSNSDMIAALPTFVPEFEHEDRRFYHE